MTHQRQTGTGRLVAALPVFVLLTACGTDDEKSDSEDFEGDVSGECSDDADDDHDGLLC